MNWKIGPARCRSDEYEAEILATDMGGIKPILSRYRCRNSDVWIATHHWPDGSGVAGEENVFDLLPPKLTREEVARECERVREEELVYGNRTDCVKAMQAALQHFLKLQEEGRV